VNGKKARKGVTRQRRGRRYGVAVVASSDPARAVARCVSPSALNAPPRRGDRGHGGVGPGGWSGAQRRWCPVEASSTRRLNTRHRRRRPSSTGRQGKGRGRRRVPTASALVVTPDRTG
jgi:hypothetical protein